jgi:hypothetical protein
VALPDPRWSLHQRENWLPGLRRLHEIVEQTELSVALQQGTLAVRTPQLS